MHRIRVVAPSGFKESLEAEMVAAAIATGLRRPLDQLDSSGSERRARGRWLVR